MISTRCAAVPLRKNDPSFGWFRPAAKERQANPLYSGRQETLWPQHAETLLRIRIVLKYLGRFGPLARTWPNFFCRFFRHRRRAGDPSKNGKPSPKFAHTLLGSEGCYWIVLDSGTRQGIADYYYIS